jgi:hypothetical protein
MTDFSLTPNFSWVACGNAEQNRFNGLLAASKPLKRLNDQADRSTRLKPGVNETAKRFDQDFCE